MTLLEVMIALAILAVGGVALLADSSAALSGSRRATASGRRLRAAVNLMNAVSVWPRRDLDLRLGPHVQGPFVLSITPRSRRLYDVTIVDSGTALVLLRTVLYREARP